MQQQNRAYLAHEYCNQHWQPMAFSQLISALEPAKLSFLGSAAIFDHIDLLNLSEAAQKILANIEHPVLKQSVRDYLVNQQFRRDYFVKGSRKLSLLEHQAALKQQAFILNTLPEAITLKVQGALGEMSLQEQVYLPLISALAEEQYRPKTFAELVAHPQLKEINFAGLNQALAILVGKGNVSPVSQYANDTTAKNNCHRLNTVLCEKAHYNGDVSVLASPITGSGIGVSRFQQMFMTAHQRGHTTANGMAEYAWNILNQQGQRLIKDQKTLETDTENLAELVMQANSFIAAMPLFNALGINIAKVENHEQKSNAYRINAVSEMQ